MAAWIDPYDLGPEESRHIQILKTPATISATTLPHIGIWCDPTITCACLIRRNKWPRAKSAKIALATRNPEACELMEAHSGSRSPTCQQKTRLRFWPPQRLS